MFDCSKCLCWNVENTRCTISAACVALVSTGHKPSRFLPKELGKIEKDASVLLIKGLPIFMVKEDLAVAGASRNSQRPFRPDTMEEFKEVKDNKLIVESWGNKLRWTKHSRAK